MAQSLADLVHNVRRDSVATLGDEARCLASAVYYEAKGEPLDGQLAVAQVILNRLQNNRYGDSICAVVKAPKQFGFVRNGQFPKPVKNEAWATAKAIAIVALANIWRDVVPDATHFHTTAVHPGWKLQRVATIGSHIFYR